MNYLKDGTLGPLRGAQSVTIIIVIIMMRITILIIVMIILGMVHWDIGTLGPPEPPLLVSGLLRHSPTPTTHGATYHRYHHHHHHHHHSHCNHKNIIIIITIVVNMIMRLSPSKSTTTSSSLSPSSSPSSCGHNQDKMGKIIVQKWMDTNGTQSDKSEQRSTRWSLPTSISKIPPALLPLLSLFQQICSLVNNKQIVHNALSTQSLSPKYKLFFRKFFIGKKQNTHLFSFLLSKITC